MNTRSHESPALDSHTDPQVGGEPSRVPLTQTLQVSTERVQPNPMMLVRTGNRKSVHATASTELLRDIFIRNATF